MRISHTRPLIQTIAAEKFSCFLVLHFGRLGFDLPANGGRSGVGPVGHFVELEAAYRSLKVGASVVLSPMLSA